MRQAYLAEMRGASLQAPPSFRETREQRKAQEDDWMAQMEAEFITTKPWTGEYCTQAGWVPWRADSRQSHKGNPLGDKGSAVPAAVSGPIPGCQHGLR